MIDVRGQRELRAAALAMRAAPRQIRNAINRASRQTMNPVWKAAVDAHAATPLEQTVLTKGARIKPGNPAKAIAATSTRKLRGGLIPATQWPAIEFGSTPTKTTRYTATSPKGTKYPLTRHTARQLRARRKNGYTVYPAIAEVGPRMVALWVHIIVRTYHDAIEGK